MSNFAYRAVDLRGVERRGSLDVSNSIEAVRRIKEMGLFPTRVIGTPDKAATPVVPPRAVGRRRTLGGWLPGRRIKTAKLCVFTRQLATLLEAGMPLLRSLRVLQEQEENRRFRTILEDLAFSIEDGQSFAEAVSNHPKVFNRLYVSMVKAGEIGGAMDVTLARLAEFMEKAARIKGRIQAALYYPCAVLTVAVGIVSLLMVYVIPRFQEIFSDLADGRPLPPFTRFVFGISNLILHHFWVVPLVVGACAAAFTLAVRTETGRLLFDRVKLSLPLLGKVFRKAAIGRIARTLGTLAGNGVPILQALTIVKETAGNAEAAKVVARAHESVKQGEPLAPTLKNSPLFPSMVAGMVDVGEQTGALPEMLLRIADTYDEEVNNTANSLTSLLEPILILFLAVVVGSIVIAMFLPLITVTFDGPGNVQD